MRLDIPLNQAIVGKGALPVLLGRLQITLNSLTILPSTAIPMSLIITRQQDHLITDNNTHMLDRTVTRTERILLHRHFILQRAMK